MASESKLQTMVITNMEIIAEKINSDQEESGTLRANATVIVENGQTVTEPYILTFYAFDLPGGRHNPRSHKLADQLRTWHKNYGTSATFQVTGNMMPHKSDALTRKTSSPAFAIRSAVRKIDPRTYNAEPPKVLPKRNHHHLG